jgi:lysophospholipase L1-like esterase
MGYVSSQEVIDLEEQLRPNTALDVAIFFHGFNDVAATVANLRPGVPIAQAAREIEFNVLKHRTPELLGVVLRRSAIGKTLRPFFQRPEQPAVPAQPASTAAAPGSAEALLDQTLSITFANHEIVRLLAARGHFSTLFYWQPTVFEKLRRTPSEQSEAKTNSIAQFIEYSSRRVEEFITGGAAETRPRDTYLLGHAFDDSRWSDAPAFLDACHLNEPGTEWIAKHLAADLKLVLSARREAAAD